MEPGGRTGSAGADRLHKLLVQDLPFQVTCAAKEWPAHTVSLNPTFHIMRSHNV